MKILQKVLQNNKEHFQLWFISNEKTHVIRILLRLPGFPYVNMIIKIVLHDYRLKSNKDISIWFSLTHHIKKNSSQNFVVVENEGANVQFSWMGNSPWL